MPTQFSFLFLFFLPFSLYSVLFAIYCYYYCFFLLLLVVVVVLLVLAFLLLHICHTSFFIPLFFLFRKFSIILAS